MLPYSLAPLSDALTGMKAPAGTFDSNGEWEHSYIMWNPARAVKNAESARAGNLRIRKRLTPDGKIRLQVAQIIQMQGVNGSGKTKATVTCAKDELCTPMTWKIDSEIISPAGKQVHLTATGVTGEADKGNVLLHAEKDMRIKASERLSSNWSLFEAVQRLPFDAGELRFDMLEELELLKPEHRLFPGAGAEVEIGGRMVRLHSFEQLGRGILPMTYWLDDQHRLIVAVNQRRAYLFDLGMGGAK